MNQDSQSSLSTVALLSPLIGVIIAIAPLAPGHILILGSIFGLGMVTILAWSERQFLGPMAFLGLAAIFQYYGPALDILLHPISTSGLTGGIDLAADAMRLVTAGMALIFLGYIVARRHSPSPTDRWRDGLSTTVEWWNESRADRMAILYVVIGIFSLIVFFLTANTPSPDAGGISAKRIAPTGFINFGINIGFVGALVLLSGFITRFQSREWVDYFVLIVAWLIPFIYGVYTSARLAIFLPIVVAAVMVYRVFGRPRSLPMLGAILTAFGLMSAILVLRPATGTTGLSRLLDPSFLVLNVIGAQRGGLPVIAQLLSRQGTLDPWWGITLIQWVLYIIPDVLLPITPTRVGQQLGPLLYGIQTGTPPTLIGELYLNFRLVGVVVGTLIFGVILALLSNWSRRISNAPPVILANSILLTHISFLGLYSSVGTTGFRLLFWGIPLSGLAFYVMFPSINVGGAPAPVQNSRATDMTNRVITGYNQSRTKQVVDVISGRIRRYGLFIGD